MVGLVLGGQVKRTRKVAGSTTTVFHYDIFGNLILETTNTGTTKFAYVYDDSQSLIGHVKRASNVDTLTCVHADHEGTPRIGTDTNKTVTWKWEGRAFGNTAATQDPDGNGTTVVINQRYGNGYYDSESGLWYVWNRYFRPGAGQWITSDPMSLAEHIQMWRNGEGPLELNSYVYGLDNPLRYTDPYGLFSAADLPTLPQGLVDSVTGFGDSVSLGLTGLIRDASGIDGGVNKCSDAYRYGGYGAFALGGSRLVYAGLAKGYSAVASSGAAASAFRSGLRTAFGGGKSFRPPNLAKYPIDDALRGAAGRTNPIANAIGAGVAVSGAVNTSGCGCSQ